MSGDSVLHEILSRGEGFGHRQHLELTWRCLAEDDEDTAAMVVADAIRRVARAHGEPDKFHATMTAAWVRCVAVHRERWPAASFNEFAARNPDLLNAKLLEHFFSPALLASESARSVMAEPDRHRLPALNV